MFNLFLYKCLFQIQHLSSNFASFSFRICIFIGNSYNMSNQVPVKFNSKLFLSTHGLQKGKISPMLEQFKPKINWQTANKILDIGCGPGDITVNDLFSQASEQAEMTGIDISPAMLELANKAYNDPRLKFILGDISDTKFAENYKEYFDLVFSFYCFHYIQNQRQAMENIYHVLKPGGKTLFSILIGSPSFLLNQIMAKKEKWSSYIQYQPVISPTYYNVENPEYKVKNLLVDIGFSVEDCFLSTLPITVSSKENYFNFIQSIHPYLNQIPEYLHEEYLEECKRELFSNNKLITVSDTTGELSYALTNIVAFAAKK